MKTLFAIMGTFIITLSVINIDQQGAGNWLNFLTLFVGVYILTYSLFYDKIYKK